ncbi:hypothetical protein V8C86DRAFT_2571935 [Haematococcus lacustris]
MSSQGNDDVDSPDNPVEALAQVGSQAMHSLLDPAADKLKGFMESDVGQKAVAHLQQQTMGPLMLPGMLLEDLLVHRVKQTIRETVHKNVVHYAYFFSWRAAVMCCALHATKHLATRLARRGGKRLQQAVRFATEVALPTGFFGPVLGVTMGILELTGTLPLPPLPGAQPGGPADPGSNPGSGSGSDEARTGSGSGAAVLAGVQQAALRDTGSMLAGVLGQTNPTASSLPPLQSNSAAAQMVGALTGLPVAPPAA